MDDQEPKAPAYGPPLTQSPRPAQVPTFGVEPQTYVDRERVDRSANWFFWIAALSMINSIALHAGGNFRFFLGLGLTEITDAVASQFGGAGTAAALVFDVIVASALVGLGLVAKRMAIWPFVVGMVFYALDALVLLLLQDFFSAAFHAYVLYQLWRGIAAIRSARAAAV